MLSSAQGTSSENSQGSGMNLMDVKERVWLKQALQAAAPDLEEKLGKLAPAHAVAGLSEPYFVQRYQFNKECLVIQCSGDNPNTLKGLNEGTRDLTKQKWSYKVGLKGETLSLHTLDGSSSVEWLQGSFVAQTQPLTWYKTTFNAPKGDDPLALDMNGMGKGQIWVNGEAVGRYWPANIFSVDKIENCRTRRHHL